jgi:hypothetical protein
MATTFARDNPETISSVDKSLPAHGMVAKASFIEITGVHNLDPMPSQIHRLIKFLKKL